MKTISCESTPRPGYNKIDRQRCARAALGFVVGSLIMACPVIASAQMGDGTPRSDQALIKVFRVELLHQIMPVLLKKEQYRKLLQPLEQCRKRVADLQKREAEEMIKLEARLDAAIAGAKSNGNSPPREIMEEISKLVYASRMGRQLAAQQNIDDMMKVFATITDVGQRRAAANSLDMKAFGVNLKPEEMTEEAKIRFFVSEVLLHPQAYPIFVFFSKDNPAEIKQ